MCALPNVGCVLGVEMLPRYIPRLGVTKISDGNWLHAHVFPSYHYSYVTPVAFACVQLEKDGLPSSWPGPYCHGNSERHLMAKEV